AQRQRREAGPGAGGHGDVALHEFLGKDQYHRESVFGDRVVIGAGCDRDGHSVIAGGSDVDGIVTDTDAGDDAKPRILLQYAARVGFAAGETGIDAVELVEQLTLDHLARDGRELHIKASATQDIKPYAGAIGKGGGADEDCWHGSFSILKHGL